MAKSPTIPEAKIRQAIWMLKKGKTKKAVCDHVGIAYSPKRLDTLIEDFHKRIEREKQLKAKARFKKVSESEKKSMADDYLKGDGLSAIANRNFISPQRVKKFLMELNVPLRSRGKKKAAKVEHVVQDLDIKFKVGQKVFIADTSEYAEVKEVFDEEWIEVHRNPIRRKYVEHHGMQRAKKIYGEDYEGKEDVHWTIYWEFDDGSQWKEWAIKNRINQVESVIEETGRESYRLYILGDQGHFTELNRHKLYPVMTVGN